MNQGFPPIYNSESKILILGSFPSVKSRQNGFYYANKQNRFWKMLSTIFDQPILDDDESKTKFLLKNKIALFDVVTQSNIQGSSDTNLSKSQNTITDISFLLPPNTKVEKILCNGKTAFKLLINFHKGVVCENGTYLVLQSKTPIICLPSTSPANPRFSVEAWKTFFA